MDTAAKSGHFDDNNNDSDKRRRRSGRGQGGHDDNKATGKTPTMNTMTAMDGIMVADTMTTGMAGMTTSLPDIGNGSSGINVAPPAIPTYSGASTRRAFLEERAALLNQRASEAAAVAREAVTDAADFNNAHASIVAKHHKMFLERAFGITSDGMVTIELKKEFKSVKTYQKYTDMIHVMSNWSDDAVLKEASSDDPVAAAIQKFRKSNTCG